MRVSPIASLLLATGLLVLAALPLSTGFGTHHSFTAPNNRAPPSPFTVPSGATNVPPRLPQSQTPAGNEDRVEAELLAELDDDFFHEDPPPGAGQRRHTGPPSGTGGTPASHVSLGSVPSSPRVPAPIRTRPSGRTEGSGGALSRPIHRKSITGFTPTLLHHPDAQKKLLHIPGNLNKRTCPLKRCPAYMPVLYFAVPYRNRARSLRRLVLSLLAELRYERPYPVECVCLVVADFASRVVGPKVESAVYLWPFGLTVVRIDGDFIPNLGIQLGLEVALQTMPRRSILVTLDADSMVMQGFIGDVLRFTANGVSATFPAPVSLTAPDLFKMDSKSFSSKAIMAIWVDDLYKMGGFPLTGVLDDRRFFRGPPAKMTAWSRRNWDLALTSDPRSRGIADNLMYRLVRSSHLSAIRFASPSIVHFSHPQADTWLSSNDGVVPLARGVGDVFKATAKYANTPPWFPFTKLRDLPSSLPTSYNQAAFLLRGWAANAHQQTFLTSREWQKSLEVLKVVMETPWFKRWSHLGKWPAESLLAVPAISLSPDVLEIGQP